MSLLTMASHLTFFVQALRYALRDLVEDGGAAGSIEEQAVALAHDYLEKFMLEYTNYLSSKFIREALDVLRNVCKGEPDIVLGLTLDYIERWQQLG